MGEFILQKPLFPGQNEQSQIDKIFLVTGTLSIGHKMFRN